MPQLVARALPFCTTDCNRKTSPSYLSFVGFASSFHKQGMVVATEVVQMTAPSFVWRSSPTSQWTRDKAKTSTEEQTCRICRNAQGTSQSRISESRRWSQVFQGYVETPFYQKSSDLCRFYPFIRARRGDIEMVKWLGKFSLLLKRRRDAWMDMLPVSAMNQERRETKYLADVSQLHEERQRRNVTALDPNSQVTRDQRHGTQLRNHERLFHFVIT